ncbi:unnamed protein product, partial [Mesorhabditis spiculigera]
MGGGTTKKEGIETNTAITQVAPGTVYTTLPTAAQTHQMLLQQQSAQTQAAASSSGTTATNASLPQYLIPGPSKAETKYQQLLCLFNEVSKDMPQAYTGNKHCAERIKRFLVHARILTRECIMEADRDRALMNQVLYDKHETPSAPSTKQVSK